MRRLDQHTDYQNRKLDQSGEGKTMKVVTDK